MAKVKINEESRTLYLARALYDAVEDCNIQQVHILLSENKASPNVLMPEEGMTAFHLAAGHENVSFGKNAVSLFLHNGGNPNVCCDGNRTVLHIAVAWNRSSVVEILLKSSFTKPNPFIKDDEGLNVFNYAVKFNSWESLATLQSYIKNTDYISNLNKEIDKPIQSKYIEKEDPIFMQKTENSIGAESTINQSDRLHTSSGYFNSGESLNSTSKSIKHDSVNLKEEISNHSLLSLTTDSLNDALNKNISSEYQYTKKLNDIPSSVYSDLSTMSSLSSLSDDYEDIENISFPSQHLLSDTELIKFNEVDLKTENNCCQKKTMCVSYSEWLTEISGLSSCFGSDDYFTCHDTNSERHIHNIKTDKTKIELEEIANSISMASLCEPQRSISKISEVTDNLGISTFITSDETSSILSELVDDYDTDYVRQSLREHGCPPGPLVPSTKRVYVRKLNQILKDDTEHKYEDKHLNILTGASYSYELKKVLNYDGYDAWKKTIQSWSSLEDDIVYEKSGSSFTYLLLDPRITRNLPVRANQIDNPIEIWKTFISSIFYIGKGTKSRPNDHMNEAFNSWIQKTNKELSPKTKYILDLWKEKKGVVCVQAFHHLVLNEAHIREAAMIDAIGVEKLTNEKRGTYYDKTLRWRNSDRCKLGCHLLYRAMLVFLADGERQLQPIDLTT